MLPELTEFMQSNERDLSVLAEARKALLDHPLKPSVPDVYDPSCCRLLAVTAVGAIEHQLEAWRQKDPLGVLEEYFGDRVPNGQRVAALYKAFRDVGIGVDRTVFDDYLAVKYLRNTIVHARWKDEETKWLEARGFPADTRKLNAEHWRRIRWVVENMIWYVYRVFWPTAEALFTSHPEFHDDLPSVLSRRDFGLVLWTNLERVDSRLRNALKAATEAGRIRRSWTSKPEWWSALLDASRSEPDLFAPQRQLVEHAVFSWDEYSRLTCEPTGVTVPALADVVPVLRELRDALHQTQSCFQWPRDITDEEAPELLRAQLAPNARVEEKRTIEALRLGAAAYDAMVNRTPCDLFAVALPIVHPDAVRDLGMRATHAIVAMEVSQLWKGLFDPLDDSSWLAQLKEFVQSWGGWAH